MPLLASTSIAAAAHALPVTLALSGIFGSISLTSWICLLLPQLFANYKAKSADGLSMAFLIVWLLGDITNLIGALFTRLAPTAIALAGYFCIADIVLIGQALYYNTLNARRASRAEEARPIDPSEESPLINNRNRRRSSSYGLPGSQRRHATHTESSMEPLRKIVTGEDDTPDSSPWIHNTLSLLAVYVIGFAGWFVSYKVGAWENGDSGTPDAPEDAQTTIEIAGLILGYISAVLYLCLVAYSQDKKYLLNALPWLLGSLGTIAEDLIIFAQFRIYSNVERESAIEP
ncbi:PQ loop repeat-domain-containing protein [Fusarium acuminatum]|uniref:PQ loop repeat-domain-containing protein n=1 Tax=Fusarium acuminatum TaxID=5515 RepID=A0ABZ2X7W5_9HYPO